MMALLCLGPSLVKAQEREGVKVEFLGTNNTMIRITGEGKYLMLPIQDNGEEATLNLLVTASRKKISQRGLPKTKWTIWFLSTFPPIAENTLFSMSSATRAVPPCAKPKAMPAGRTSR